jgi:hypothetical protein
MPTPAFTSIRRRVHDFHRNTAEALAELIRQLKAGGYKVVPMVPKGELTTVPKYDDMLAHEDKLSSNNTRPESSVIRRSTSSGVPAWEAVRRKYYDLTDLLGKPHVASAAQKMIHAR